MTHRTTNWASPAAAAAAGAAVVTAYLAVVRPRMLRAGATAAEADGPYPGEGLIPDGTRSGTMAVTIDAPRSRVWAWLVQMGTDRAGWYSWDRLDNFGRASAWSIHPEWLISLLATIWRAHRTAASGGRSRHWNRKGSWGCACRLTCAAARSIRRDSVPGTSPTRCGGSS